MSGTHRWPWERLAQSNAPSHAVLTSLLAPQPGERWLDIGTGSGGIALRAAQAGATVTALDIAPEALDEARLLAEQAGVELQLDVGDARALPYPDASFDVVASAFGVQFAEEHAVAARELARVCRPGGRLGLTLMPQDSRAGEMWTLIRRYGGHGGDHPGAFSTNAHDLLDESFEIEVERREAPPEPAPPPEQQWEYMKSSIGALHELTERLDEQELARLRDEFIALRARFQDTPGSYYVVVGRRR
jgi:SAM-dependent methyltransferase